MKIHINGTPRIDFITQEVNFNYDSVADTFSFSMPFKDEDIFKPLEYYSVDIWSDSNRKLLTGTILNHHFKSNSQSNEITISGYSKTGILGDCPNIPEAIKANEKTDDVTSGVVNVITDIFTKTGDSSNFGDTSLLELAKKLVAPFGINILVDDIVKDKVNEMYEMCTTSPDESVSAYLGKLSTLKNIVLRSNPNGDLVFTQIDENKSSVAKFTAGVDPQIEMSLEVNGQAMFNKIHISGRVDLYSDDKADAAKSGESEVIENRLIKLTKRETLKIQGEEVTMIKDVCKAALADELKNIVVSITITGDKLERSKDEKGNEIYLELKPGDLVDIKAPDIFIRQETKFMIRSISIKENAKEKTQILKCVLPQTMTGTAPYLIFG
jgi:prophage tail gpP-like protein